MEEKQKLLERQLNFKLSQIEKNLEQQRIQDWKQSGQTVSSTKMPFRTGVRKRPTKFHILQLSSNKSKLELESFQKFSLLQEKEQRREDMVLMATQQAIVEASQIANGTKQDIKQQQKQQSKAKHVQLARGTFFQYKNKTLQVDQITESLTHKKRQRRLKEEQELAEQGEDQGVVMGTQQNKDLIAFKKLRDQISNKMNRSEQEVPQHLSKFGIVKLQSTENIDLHALMNPHQKQQDGFSNKSRNIHVITKVKNQEPQSAQLSPVPLLKAYQTLSAFTHKRQSHQQSNSNTVNRDILPHIGSPTTTLTNINSPVSVSDARPRYQQGILDLPDIKRLRNQKLYKQIKSIIEAATLLKDDDMISI